MKSYIIARENNKCQICGKDYDDNGWHLHHIKQRKDGGTDRVDTVATHTRDFSHEQVGFKKLVLMCHNNNWQFICTR